MCEKANYANVVFTALLTAGLNKANETRSQSSAAGFKAAAREMLFTRHDLKTSD